MYPTLYHMLQDLFGLEIGAFRIINTFGFLVALSFIASNLIMAAELKRKEREGLIRPFTKKTIKGAAPGISDVLPNALFGFILGWKGVYLFTHFDSVSGRMPDFIFSMEGSIPFGIIGALLLGGYDYYKIKKAQLPVPVAEESIMHPWELMPNITVIAAIAGLLGAKIFHNLEYINEFMADPIGSLLSFSGLTFFGGLLAGAAAVLWYTSRHGIHWRHMLDTGGPTMMMAYALGRIGCHLSGDGDWGIVNTDPAPAWLSWLPDWIWAYNYPNNVLQQCNPYEGAEALLHQCNWDETPYLIAPVFPTPFYETIACLVLFGVLWKLRLRIHVPGVLFGIYMIMAGVERFFIEKIRVNSHYFVGEFSFTQAELISVLMVLGGIAAIWWFRKNPKLSENTVIDTPETINDHTN